MPHFERGWLRPPEEGLAQLSQTIILSSADERVPCSFGFGLLPTRMTDHRFSP